MFIKENALKALMKAAFKGSGLHVWNNNGDIALAGTGWAVYIIKEYVTRAIKGEIVTLTGDIPENGRQYEATREGIQEEVPEMFCTNVFKEAAEYERRGCTLTDTLISVRGVFGTYRIYEGVPDRPVVMSETKAGMISQSNCEREEKLNSPVTGRDNGRVYWTSETMAMTLWEKDFSEIEEKDPEAAETILRAFRGKTGTESDDD